MSVFFKSLLLPVYSVKDQYTQKATWAAKLNLIPMIVLYM